MLSTWQKSAKADEAADESAPMHEEAVNQQKKPMDGEPTKDLSILVGIGREVVILLKCIVGLVYLVLFGIVYIVSRL
jgi:predicted flap endonuclease-1-like 5' DNA nuclease